MADHVQDPADPSKSAKPMTSQQLIIEYSKPGISSPVFVAGTFTSWEPIQMETKQASDSAASKDEELHFIYIFKNVTEGEHQYKFRLGPGDWWATDERVKTVVDENGNKNNVTYVKSSETTGSTAPLTLGTGLSMKHDSTPEPPPAEGDPVKNSITSDEPTKAFPVRVEPSNEEKVQQQLNQAQEKQSSISSQVSLVFSSESSPKPSQPGLQGRNEDEITVSSPALTEPKIVKLAASRDDETLKEAEHKQTAKTADEVADTASKLDVTPPKRPSDSMVPRTPEESKTNGMQKGSILKFADQTDAIAVTPKLTAEQDRAPSAGYSKIQDALSSPTVPPAPAVTPVAISPPVTPHKLDQSPPEASIPLPPTPATPLKSLDAITESPSPKIPIVSKQEIAIATPHPSVPPTTPETKVNVTRKAEDTTSSFTSPSAAAQIPLPLTPAHEAIAPKPRDASEPVSKDNFGAEHQTSADERSTGVLGYIQAVPNAVQAFFTGVVNAILGLLTAVFNPQRGGQSAKGSKKD